MNEPRLNWNWGVPDWRDESAYPKPDDLTLEEWCWEFLRRRNDYRADFLLNVSKQVKWWRDEWGEWPPTRFGDLKIESPSSPDFFVSMPGSTRMYGVLVLLNPAAAKPGQLMCNTYGSMSFDLPAENDKRWMPIYFDLSKPIQPQLDKVKQSLECFQRKLVGTVASRRQRQDKWPLYLRVLDADDAGATLEEIIETFLLPNPDETSQGDFDRQADKHVDKLAHALLKQARRVKDNFPS